MGNPKEATISTSEGDVVVHKLVIAQYSALLELISGMPAFTQVISEGDLSNSTTVVAAISKLAYTALPELSKLLAFTTNQPPEFFLQLDLVEVLDVINGILDVNDYERILAAIKKISGRVRPPNAAPAATSTTGSTTPSTS